MADGTTDSGGGCRLDKLGTEFTPDRITLHVELIPPEGCTFDAPMSEPGKRLGMVANYARTVFDVAMQQKRRQRKK